MGELRGHFRPEFLNRVDEIVLFKPLTLAEIERIVDLQIDDVQQRLADRRLDARADRAGAGADRPRGLRPGLRRAPAAALHPARGRDADRPGAASPATSTTARRSCVDAEGDELVVHWPSPARSGACRPSQWAPPHTTNKGSDMTHLQTERGIVRVPAGTWKVDPAHSSVGFEVKHMMIATVRGRFTEFDGHASRPHEDLAESRVYGSAQVASIDTGQADRDAHLRGPDFFDAERYPRDPLRVDADRERRGRPLPRHRRPHDQGRHARGDARRDGPGRRRGPVGQRARRHRVPTARSTAPSSGSPGSSGSATGGLLVGEEVKILIDVSAVRTSE